MQTSSSDRPQHPQSLSSSSSSAAAPPPHVGYGHPSPANSIAHNRVYQDQNSHTGNNPNGVSNLRNSMVAPHRGHQAYAHNGNMLVNGGSSSGVPSGSSRQAQSSATRGTVGGGGGSSQSSQASQMTTTMNHQPQKEEPFDVSGLCLFSGM